MQVRVQTADLPGARLKRLRATLVAVAAAALLAGCSAISGNGGPTAAVLNGGNAPPAGGGQGTNSEENSRIVAAYGGVYHDPKVEQTLVPIVSSIVAASDRPDINYKITILNAPAVNAFALPGGYLYVTRGLLALANDSSEVAAVLAHEMGHITANHAAKRQDKAREAMLVSRTVGEVLDNDPNGQMALAATKRTLAAFSRQQELEADAIGIRTIGKAGYDPFAAARFLTAMAEYADFRANSVMRNQPDFLATHPSTPERIAFAEKAARAFGAPGIGNADRDRYLDGIDGMVYGDDPTQGFVRDRTFIHPKIGVAFTVPEGFVIDNTSDAVLATGADGTALRFDAVGLADGTDLTDYLRSGWINGLDETSVKRLSIAGMDAAYASARTKGWNFQIAVVHASGPATYRFIFANEQVNDAFTKEAQDTVASFRTLSQREIAGLKALHVHVVTAVAGDTTTSLARRMRGVDRPRDLFLALNALKPGDRIEPGTKYKIVDDR